jgi:spore maturation protein CgeB
VCGTPVISDAWEGLETFFDNGSEILVARSPADVVQWLVDMPDPQRRAIGERARQRVLSCHTAAHRAAELESHVLNALSVEPAA